MDLLIPAIVGTVAFAFIVAVIAVIIQSHRPEVSLTNHAIERLAERCNISGFRQQRKFADNAFIYGRTYDQLSGYEAKKLYNIQHRHGENYTAKLYENYVFIFADEDNLLITVYETNEPDIVH